MILLRLQGMWQARDASFNCACVCVYVCVERETNLQRVAHSQRGSCCCCCSNCCWLWQLLLLLALLLLLLQYLRHSFAVFIYLYRFSFFISLRKTAKLRHSHKLQDNQAAAAAGAEASLVDCLYPLPHADPPLATPLAMLAIASL